jgi:hypothetical protein
MENQAAVGSAQQPRNAFLPHFDRLEEGIRESQQYNSQNASRRPLQINDDDPPSGTLWSYLEENGKFTEYTHFTEAQCTDLYHASLPFIATHRQRGPRPKVGWADALIIYLVWAKTAMKLDELAAFLRLKPATLEKTIARIRPVLFDTLYSRWWASRRRPRTLQNTNYPYIALLCDSTSIEVFRPKTRFEEAKQYWDEKNSIYAIKKEIAVCASAPHYALFSQKRQGWQYA